MIMRISPGNVYGKWSDLEILYWKIIRLLNIAFEHEKKEGEKVTKKKFCSKTEIKKPPGFWISGD